MDVRRRKLVTIGSLLAVLVTGGCSNAVVPQPSGPVATVRAPTTGAVAAPTVASPSDSAPVVSSGLPTSSGDSTRATATRPTTQNDAGAPGAPPTTAATTPTNPVPPAAPSNVSGTLDTATRTITFHWTNNADNADAYKVVITYGVTPVGGSWLNANATSYTYPDKVLGETYCADVIAHNFYGEASAPRTCLNLGYMVPAAPSNLTATAISSTTIRVAWSANSSNEDGFSFYQDYTIVAAPAHSVYFDSTGLAPDQAYCFYNLRAFNAYGISNAAPGPNVCVKTLAA
jgi:hypothetical protein